MRRREIRPTQSGELRHVCNIEQLLGDVDMSGTPMPTYRLWATNVYFAIDDWKPYEAMQAQELGHQLNTRIRMRWRPGVVESMRLAYCTNPGQSPQIWEYYEITGIVRDIALRNELQLTCVKRTQAGFRQGVTGTADAGLGGAPSETFNQLNPTTTPISFEQVAPASGAQTFTLQHAAAASGWRLLCINGLQQAVTDYSVSGTLLSLPSALNVLAGDLITFDYYPAAS